MAVLAIAGSGRGAGKTAVGCALMAAMPEFAWLAVKVTPHWHGADEALWEDFDLALEKDTGRYLAAGARRSFLAGGVADPVAAAWVAEARVRARECDAALIESNQVAAGVAARAGEPAITLAVLSGAQAEWKASLWECLAGVDGLVLGEGVSPAELETSFPGKPVFRLASGQWSTPELLAFVRARLGLAES